MSPTTIRFIKVGMAYFVLGALQGTLLAVPVTRDLLYKAPGAQWRLAHTHLNLAVEVAEGQCSRCGDPGDAKR